MLDRLLKVVLVPALGAALLLLPLESKALSLLPSFGSKGTVIWSARHQYVRLVPQGAVDGKTPPPNSQPVHLGVAQLRAALGGIDQVDVKNTVVAHAGTRPVFTADELDDLVPALVHGLANARPDQDVAFVVEGAPGWEEHPQLQAIGGRVFFRDGKLNLIFGNVGRLVGFSALRVQGGYNLTPDMRTHPIRVGVRAKPIPHHWVLSLRDGMSFHSNRSGVLRDDWVELDIPKVVAALQAVRPVAAVQHKSTATPVALAGASRQLRKETLELVAQRQAMQLQMAHMQKELSEIHMRREQAAAQPRGAVARLSLLDKLLRKKLITQKEYDAKRREILGQL